MKNIKNPVVDALANGKFTNVRNELFTLVMENHQDPDLIYTLQNFFLKNAESVSSAEVIDLFNKITGYDEFEAFCQAAGEDKDDYEEDEYEITGDQLENEASNFTYEFEKEVAEFAEKHGLSYSLSVAFQSKKDADVFGASYEGNRNLVINHHTQKHDEFLDFICDN